MKRRVYSLAKSQIQLQNTKLKLIVAAFVILGVAVISLFIYMNVGLYGNANAAPGKDGAVTISTVNKIVNEFTALTADASAGDNKIFVTSNNLNTNGRFAGSLANGDLVMIIQMQGATIGTVDASTYGNITAYNNCGKYELAEVSGLSSSNRINLVNNLKNSYTMSGKVQVVRVPRYSSITVNSGASLTTQAWDGSTGGLLCLEVNGAAVINGTIDVSGKGFRGGTVKQISAYPGNHTIWRSTTNTDGAEKGESVAGSQLTYDGLNGRYGRGAPANGGGGGNSHNASGGGGANGGTVASWTGTGNPDLSNPSWVTIWNLEGGLFSSTSSSGGGRGGYTYSANAANPSTKAPGDVSWGGDKRTNVGGYGGRPLDYSTGKIFMGGGGGAGDSNDSFGTSGGNGGGLVFIAAGSTVSGTGTINANGNSVGSTTGPQGWDGSGGGGGGGAVIIYTRGGNVSNLTINAKGGNGGNQDLTGDPEAEGTGGGGGGGYIAVTASISLTKNVTMGLMGSTNSSTMTAFTPNGGTKGATGSIGGAPGNPYSSSSVLPVELISFETKLDKQLAIISWKTASEKNNDYFNVERSSDGRNFSIIGKVKGAGNSTAINTYSLTDNHILPGVSYYRLKQTDFDGHYEYFRVACIKNESKNISDEEDVQIKFVGPNPFSDSFNAEIKTQNPGTMELRIMAMNGQLIYKENIKTDGGITVYNFHDEINMAPGIYFIRVMQEGKISQAFKIIKK